MSLFSKMALKGDISGVSKYLGVRNDGDEYYVEYKTDAVLSPNAKFAVENAHDGLIHIRSCLNNKYWVRSASDGEWIVAKGVEAVDDKKLWTCTLFRMNYHDDKTASFTHVQTNTTLRIPKDGSDRQMCLTVSGNTTHYATSLVVDLDDIVVLPKLVAFKGDNDKYFRHCLEGDDSDYPNLGCDDIGDKSVVTAVEYTNDGTCRFRAYNAPKTYNYLLRNAYVSEQSRIYNVNYSLDVTSKLFSVIKVKDNVIALRSLMNKKILRRMDLDANGRHFTDCLVACEDSITKEAQLSVLEPCFSRKVQVFEFDLDNSRIYGVTPITSATHVYNNPTDQVATAEMDLTVHNTRTTTWTNTVGVTLGVKTEFVTGIPIIAEGKIEVSAEASYEHQWQGSVEEGEEVGDVFTVNVPAYKKAIGRGVASKGTCDVPFSYVQIDHLTSGETIKTTLADGVFTGVNAYNFYSDIHYEDADP